MSQSKEVIIYSLNSNAPLKDFANSDYTTVILCFVVTDGNGNLFLSDELKSILQDKTIINTIKDGGKRRVLVSVGGYNFNPNTPNNEEAQSKAWNACADNMESFVSQLSTIVSDYGFDGVDIDWEDSWHYQAQLTNDYDPVQFLTQISKKLKTKLPDGQNFISHAPQPPFFDPQWHGAPYTQVALGAGEAIDLFNLQYYNNGDWYVGIAPASQTIKCAGTTPDPSTGQPFPSSIVGISKQGVAIEKLALGHYTTEANTGGISPSVACYISTEDTIDYLVKPLMDNNVAFAGMMGWQYSSTPYGTDSTNDWANSMNSAMNED